MTHSHFGLDDIAAISKATGACRSEVKQNSVAAILWSDLTLVCRTSSWLKQKVVSCLLVRGQH